MEGQFARAQKIHGCGLENGGSGGVYMKKWVSGSEVKLTPLWYLSTPKPKFVLTPEKIINISQKYIADLWFSHKSTTGYRQKFKH